MTLHSRTRSLFVALGLVLLAFLPPVAVLVWRWEISHDFGTWMEQPIGLQPVQGIFSIATFMLWVSLPLGPAYHHLMRALEGLVLPKSRTMLWHSCGIYAFYCTGTAMSVLLAYSWQQLTR